MYTPFPSLAVLIREKMKQKMPINAVDDTCRQRKVRRSQLTKIREMFLKMGVSSHFQRFRMLIADDLRRDP
jgi:hypothetical protein